MNPVLEKLIKLLSLEQLEDNLFRGISHDIGTNRVYGGQVLGQAIKAAQYTVGELKLHSLHAYFLRAGDHTSPIIYQVERTRDGRSFSARRVVAIQHDRPIFTVSASFQIEEQGIEYQQRSPDSDDPETYKNVREYLEQMEKESPVKAVISENLSTPFDLRPIEPLRLDKKHKAAPYRRIWLKTIDHLPDDKDIHNSMLAYISDFALLDIFLLPHGKDFLDKKLQMASLDHAMWFHRQFRADDWLLYVVEGISASGARGLAQGKFFNQKGVLVASTMQEGLIRLRDD